MDLKAKLSAAVNRAKMGPGDGLKSTKKNVSLTAPTVGMQKKENPMSKPLINVSVKKPVSTPSKPMATSSYSKPTVAPTAPASPAAKTMKDVRSENRIKKYEARATNKLNKISNPKTTEQKQERNKRVAGAISSAAGAVVGGLELVDRTRQTFPGKKTGN